MCKGKGDLSLLPIPSFPDLCLSMLGGRGLNCGGKAGYGMKGLGMTKLGGNNFGVVAATGCSVGFWRPEGIVWGLEPVEPELDDLGLVRLRGASGSDGWGGGDGVR